MGDFPWEMNELAENNQNEEVAALVENEMVPIIDDSINRLKAVESQVNEMNDLQIKAEEFAKESFKMVMNYYAGDDVTENEINQYDEKLQEKYQDVLDCRDELMDKYELEQFDEQERDSNFYKLKRMED